MKRGYRTIVAASIAALWVGCEGTASEAALDAQFAEAEQLCLDGRFAEAEALLKEYLLRRPLDAGAHYYLGRAYMAANDFRPVMAEGEYQTARRLYIAAGRTSPIKRFTPEYFEMICDLDSAKVIYLQCEAALSKGASGRLLEPVFRRALDYVERARTVMPEAAEVDQIGGAIRDTMTALGIATEV